MSSVDRDSVLGFSPRSGGCAVLYYIWAFVCMCVEGVGGLCSPRRSKPGGNHSCACVDVLTGSRVSIQYILVSERDGQSLAVLVLWHRDDMSSRSFTRPGYYRSGLFQEEWFAVWVLKMIKKSFKKFICGVVWFRACVCGMHVQISTLQ